ncbi:DUF4395 family protein [Aestuariibaculum sp. YM273]|uniref:DUF4395 family protein n=1 Tax=Aestuariibaculum sp. YM273 TaxID=3070659 RepID=UPI0027DDA9E1|nr:DUF4395 family protein [Aestuariibaculum sp. YM273]WMI64890.1 DUF4395 family protein [Aestuariibaculum sp. YM273]
MTTNSNNLSKTRINRLKAQGYLNQSDQEICELAFGNRFAFITCSILVGLGVATANILILSTMTLIAFLGIVLPYHPFDYIYNYWIRNLLNKPRLPQRSQQLKFACIIATIWLSTTVFLFYSQLYIAGYIAGTLLFLVALIVSTTDFCIPSSIYNYIFKIKINK